MLGALSGSATVLPRAEGAADQRVSGIGQRLTQPSALYAPVHLAFLPLDDEPIDDDGEVVVAVVGTIVLSRHSAATHHVESAVQLGDVAVAQEHEPRASFLPPVLLPRDRLPPVSSLVPVVGRVQIKRRARPRFFLLVAAAEYHIRTSS